MINTLKRLLYFVPILGLILQEYNMFLMKRIVLIPTTRFGYQISAFWHSFWFIVIFVNALI